MSGQLKNAPLIEALLEIRWELTKVGPDAFRDSGYRLAIGRLYDRIRDRFKAIQQLTLNEFPDELTAYHAKIQFRKEQNGWPLVQLGPGIATVNFTSPYTWDDFEEAIQFVLPKLVEAYEGTDLEQNGEGLNIISAKLRYINAITLDWKEERDVLEFLNQSLHTIVSLPDAISHAEIINGPPQHLNLQLGYVLDTPPGRGIVQFSTGHKGQEPALIWEISVHSKDEDAPKLTELETFWSWLGSAHDVIEKWFFKLIEGDLEKQFRGE
jgi:uncharacterized protein (TIGR04255 family)